MDISEPDDYQPITQNNEASGSPPLSSENNTETNSELESILSNPEEPLFQRLRLATWIELKLLVNLAAPAVAVYMINYLMAIFTISWWVYMIAIGFNAAVSVRVSNELGAGHPKSAAFCVVVVNLVSLIISVIAAIVVLALRNVFSYAFTEGEAVANAVSDLCPLLALSIILSGIQPVLSGVAVGCGWQTFVAYVNIFCYYVVGIPFGSLFGFYLKWGVKGIWWGMLGGLVTQTIILVWFTMRTDWKKEVEEARKRLDKWEDKGEPLLKD